MAWIDKKRDEIRALAVKRYDETEDIWCHIDRWHTITHKRIDAFLRKHITLPTDEKLILNVGSGGQTYGIFCDRQVHVDIVPRLIKQRPLSTVADMHNLPFLPNCFGVAICIGSVLNYCSAMESLYELQRVIKPQGIIFLEYESSSSWEYLFSESYNKSVAVVDTFYHGSPERIFVYSDEYIEQVIEKAGCTVLAKEKIHILSSFALRLKLPPKIAAQFEIFDFLFRNINFLSHGGCNTILICKKM